MESVKIRFINAPSENGRRRQPGLLNNAHDLAQVLQRDLVFEVVSIQSETGNEHVEAVKVPGSGAVEQCSHLRDGRSRKAPARERKNIRKQCECLRQHISQRRVIRDASPVVRRQRFEINVTEVSRVGNEMVKLSFGQLEPEDEARSAVVAPGPGNK